MECKRNGAIKFKSAFPSDCTRSAPRSGTNCNLYIAQTTHVLYIMLHIAFLKNYIAGTSRECVIVHIHTRRRATIRLKCMHILLRVNHAHWQVNELSVSIYRTSNYTGQSLYYLFIFISRLCFDVRLQRGCSLGEYSHAKKARVFRI